MARPRNIVTLGLVLSGALVLLGAASKSGGEDARRAIMQADSDLNDAVEAHDVAAFKALLEPGATFYSRSGPTTGRDAIAESWQPFLDRERTATLTWAPKSAEVAASGDLGFTRGEFDLRRVDENGKKTRGHGHYVTIWRKGEDGKWRVAVDIGTPAQPVEE
ncbi:MAG: nuclear transport factor 2 family protein [Acidobacteria bacterium]|nr:nuclear transport factor 2 family protein [Acidobacteriota bacterium]